MRLGLRVAGLEGACPDSPWWLWRLDEAGVCVPEAEGLWGVYREHSAAAGEGLCKALFPEGARQRLRVHSQWQV